MPSFGAVAFLRAQRYETGMAKTEVRFVDGFDDVRGWPDYAKAAGLNHRFAVIQETCRPDCVDMYFDEALWLSLLQFVRRAAPDVQIKITQDSAKEVGLDVFLAGWDKRPKEDREPPPLLLGRDAGVLKLAIETEYWNNAGGPMPYHDSYTYSLYSSISLRQAVLEHLASSNTGAWDLASEPTIGVVTRKHWWQWIW